MQNTGRTTNATIEKRLVDINEAVVRVDEGGILVALSAVVPVGAVKTLVANTADILVAAVTNSIVDHITPRRQVSSDRGFQDGAWYGGGKPMLGVVAMLAFDEAAFAEIVIVTGRAVDKLHFREFLNAAVACPRAEGSAPNRTSQARSRLLVGSHGRPDRKVQSRRRRRRLLRGNMCCAVANLPIFDVTLNEPVALIVTRDALPDTVLAEVEVAVITSGTVEVGVGNRLVTTVTADSELTPTTRKSRDRHLFLLP